MGCSIHTCLDRREFIWLSIAGMGAMMISGCSNEVERLFGISSEDMKWKPKMPPVKIYKLYLVGPFKSWPRNDYDEQAEISKIEKYLTSYEHEGDHIKFIGGDTVRDEVEVKKVMAKLGEADFVLVVSLTIFSMSLAETIINTKKPVIIFSQPFSGVEWMVASKWENAGKKVLPVMSSDYSDITRAVALLSVPFLLKNTRILLIGRPEGSVVSADLIKERLGPEIVPIGVKRLKDSLKAVDSKVVQSETKNYWIKQAEKIVEPSSQKIAEATRFYFALKKLMQEEQAYAVAANCFWFILPQNFSLPCLAFSKLDDSGLVGGCEADIDSVITKLIFTFAFGKPGFISDPVIDTSKNICIYAHCYSATRMDGPGGKRAPYIIRSHMAKSGKVALEVDLQRIGQEVTTAKLVNLDTMLIHTGKITKSPDFENKGCRTKLVTEVSDIHRLRENWGGGISFGEKISVVDIHRVVFYGNYLKPVKKLASLMDLKIVEEV